MKHENPFKYVYMTCPELYYDIRTKKYVCASNGRESAKPRCKSCPNLRIKKSDSPNVSLV